MPFARIILVGLYDDRRHVSPECEKLMACERLTKWGLLCLTLQGLVYCAERFDVGPHDVGSDMKKDAGYGQKVARNGRCGVRLGPWLGRMR
jgi:hypothetical protein